jgi:hypothetical protein
MTAADQLAQLEWARDCYAQGLGEAVEGQVAYLRALIAEQGE